MKTILPLLALLAIVSSASASEISDRTRAVELCQSAQCKDKVLLGKVRPRLIIACTQGVKLSEETTDMKIIDDFEECLRETHNLPEDFLKQVNSL